MIGLGLAAVLLAACGKQDTPAADAPTPAKDKATSALASNAPVEAAPCVARRISAAPPRSRAADGIGSTPELAVLAALQSAVAQVNGVRVASQMQSLRAGLHVDVDDEHVGDIRADAFTQQMIAGSQGAVLGYEILSQDEVRQLDEETIARVRASDEGWSFRARPLPAPLAKPRPRAAVPRPASGKATTRRSASMPSVAQARSIPT